MNTVWPTGLRAHLLALALLTLLPFLIWAVYSQWQQYDNSVSSLHTESLRITENLAADHAADINAARALLVALGNFPALGSDRETCSQYLDSIRQQHALYANLAVVRTDGSLQCSADQPSGPVNFKDRQWFKDAVANPSQFTGEYLFSRISGRAIVVLPRPIFDRDGRLTHIMLASMSLQWFEEHNATSNLPAGSVTLLINPHGTVLIRSPGDQKYIGQSIQGSQLETLLRIRSATAVDLPGLDGVERLYTAIPLGWAETPAAYLAIGIPTATLYAPAWKSLWLSVSIFGVLLVIVALAMVATYRYVVTPLQTLVQAAQHLGAGVTSLALPTQALGEVGELAREFARMSGLIREREQTLRASRHLLAESQRIAHIGSWSMDLATQRVTWTDETFRMYGLAPRSIAPVYPETMALVHPDDHAAIAHWLEECLAGRSPPPLIHRAVWPTGEVRTLIGSGELLRDESGKPVELVGTVQDITEHKRAEEELRASEQRWQFALEGARDGVWDWNLVTNEVFFSRRWKEMLGFAEHEISGSLAEWDRRVHPDDKARTYADIEKHLHGGAPYYENEHRVLCKDGTYKWILDRGRVISYDAAGKPLRMIGTHSDITDRKQAEAALRENEQRFRAVINASPVPYALNDDSGNITYLNPAFTRVFGYTLDEVSTLADWWPKAYPDPTYRDWVKTEWGQRLTQARLSGEEFEPVELAIACKDGTVKTIVASAASLAESFTGTHLVVLYDITDRKAAEQERERLSRQLQQSQKMQALGQLTGGIAHDFNNLLASILGYTDLALERCSSNETDKLTQYLTQIQRAGQRARDLIASMLAFSRRGGGVSESTPVDIVPLVNEAQKLLAAVLPSSIRLTAHYESDLPRVNLNLEALHQMIFNLCINARDALHGQGEIHLDVSSAKAVSSECDSCHTPVTGDYVALTVRDNGEGMTPEILARIFEPFYTTKGVGRGTGMGLSIVHGLVHEHGGHIQVQSRRGAGTTVTVWMRPCAAIIDDESAPAAAASPTSIGQGEWVLVVDDEVPVATLLGEILTVHGFHARVYSDSRAALAAFLAAPDEFAAVITDQTMPNLTGIELVHAIRQKRPKLPVILCTGHSDHIDEAGARKMNINHFFMKPVALDSLLQALQHALRESSH